MIINGYLNVISQCSEHWIKLSDVAHFEARNLHNKPTAWPDGVAAVAYFNGGYSVPLNAVEWYEARTALMFTKRDV